MSPRLPHKRPSERALLVGTALLFGPALSAQALSQPHHLSQAHHHAQPHHTQPHHLRSAALRSAALGTDVVTSSADDGAPGTLRSVLAAAAAGDTVTFDPSVFGTPQTITLNGTELDISQNVTIQGPGMGLLTVDAGQASYVFNITGGTVALSGMTAANGTGTNDNGDIVNQGTLTLTEVALTGSTGSGLDNEGTLTATNCLFSGITTANGGAVYNYSSASFMNCTFAGNSTAGSGGGLYNDGTASLTNCTFSGNTAPLGGAIYDDGTLSATSCTFSGNTATQSSTGGALYEDGTGTITSSLFTGSTGGDIDYDAGTLTSGGSNLLGDPSTGGDFSTAGANDQFSVSAAQALVGPLGANGGRTQTCAVLAGSPAIGGDFVNSTAADQRGDPRTAASHTIGAYEYGASATVTSLVVTPAAPSVAAGGTQQLAATATYSDGSTAAVTGTAAWLSDTASVATVSAGGLATGVAAGTAHISAAFGGQTASVLLTVTTPITTVAYTLWNSADGQVQLRAVNSDESQTTLNTFGPYTDTGDTGVAGNTALWSATAIAKSPDGSLRLLWNHPDGRVMLWRLDGLGTPLSITGYGPYSDTGDLGVPGNTALWHAVGLSVGANGCHLLWDHPDGRAALWSVAADDTFAIIGGYGPYTDTGDLGVPGNTDLWHTTALADDPDGTLRLLWNHPDGRVMLWNVAASGELSSLAGFGPYTDTGDLGIPGNTALWRAIAVQTGADGKVHLLWDHPDGRTMLWSVDGSLNLTALAGYGPYVDPQPAACIWHSLGLALTPSDQPYVLWGNGTGRTVLWNIAGDDAVSFAGIFEVANDSSRQPWMPAAVSGH